jgi:hypothetical protein
MISTEGLKDLAKTLEGIQHESNKALNTAITPEMKAQLPQDIKDLIEEGRSAINPKGKNGAIDFGKAADNAQSVLRDINRTIQNINK